MELSATARVILGMLAVEPRSGYDIKQLVDKTTRFFWAASYGQIYPELKRLTERGLVAPDEEPTGPRRRTVYRITPDGHEALAGWLREPEQTHELRDEGLLKVFFVGVLGRDEAIPVLEAKRDQHREVLASLREIEPHANATDRFGPSAVLGYGLALNEFAIEWCERTIAELDNERENS